VCGMGVGRNHSGEGNGRALIREGERDTEKWEEKITVRTPEKKIKRNHITIHLIKNNSNKYKFVYTFKYMA